MRTLVAAVGLLVVLGAVGVPAVQVGGNEVPLADAGLDQTVERGTTVHLDAAGSRDPDGEITRFAWTIETPTNDSTTITPDCPTCARTQFTPDEVGRYDVTVTVTDDDGATATDTLYVEVRPGEPPSITVAGPPTATPGSSLTYTATLQAGTADLDALAWRIDGERVRTEAVSDGQRRISLPYEFTAAGDAKISATITDADGLTATDALTVQVQNVTGSGDDGNDSTGGDDGTGGGGAPAPIASRLSPVLEGDQLLTGEAPFAATYRLDVATDEVVDVTWWRDGHRAGGGASERISWTPGRHTLYAVVEYTDGSTDTARFPDGTSDVAVDPQPGVDLADLTTQGRIAGTVEATDDFGNLRAVSVSIDGQSLVSKSVDPVRLRAGDGGERLSLAFDESEITPGQTHRLTIQARDARGQTATLTRTVEPVGTPEIVRSEFVNGPVDSYHPRLDSDRYTAHHVLEIKLNGVDPVNISVDHATKDPLVMQLREPSRGRSHSDSLVVTSYWAASEPGEYEVEDDVNVDNSGTGEIDEGEASFQVTPSPPESRIDVTSDGTPEDAKENWGLVVDASDSFDPDRTPLDYAWLEGARSISADDSIAKFNSLDINGLVLTDEYDLSTTVTGREILRHYTPPVRTVTERTDGPYRPDESVRFRVRTGEYKLPKLTYYNETTVRLRLADRYDRMLWWECMVVGPFDESLVDQHDWDCLVDDTAEDPDRRGNHYHEGVLTFDAAEFADGDAPTVELYNAHTPNRSARQLQFPEITVLEKGVRTIANTSVRSTRYLVEEPEFARQETTLPSQRDAYLDEGFSVERTEQSATNYTIEQRVQTQSAEYDTRQRSFDTRGRCNTFLAQNPDWERGETSAELRNTTTTELVWRDQHGGSGTFTGETKRVQVDSADYRTEHEYRHEYTVERTRTREVTRTRQVRVPVERTRTVENCNPLGCWEHTETYTVWVTKTQEYTTTEEYTVSVTKTSTYWAVGKRHPDDTRTGDTRRVKIDDADYDTRYQYRLTTTTQEWVYDYTATRTVQIQEAEYDWQHVRSTTSDRLAEWLAMQPDYRIATTAPATRWFLTKRTGTTRTWTASPANTSRVVTTEATLNETIVRTYHHPDTGDTTTEPVDHRIRDYQFDGYLAPEEIQSRRTGTEVEENN